MTLKVLENKRWTPVGTLNSIAEVIATVKSRGDIRSIPMGNHPYAMITNYLLYPADKSPARPLYVRNGEIHDVHNTFVKEVKPSQFSDDDEE